MPLAPVPCAEGVCSAGGVPPAPPRPPPRAQEGPDAEETAAFRDLNAVKEEFRGKAKELQQQRGVIEHYHLMLEQVDCGLPAPGLSRGDADWVSDGPPWNGPGPLGPAAD